MKQAADAAAQRTRKSRDTLAKRDAMADLLDDALRQIGEDKL